MNKKVLFSSFVAVLILASCANNETETIELDENVTSQLQDDRFIETPLEAGNDSEVSDYQEDVIFDDSISQISEDDTVSESDESMIWEEQETLELSWNYLDYSDSLVGESENTVVFFHASWCPSCKAADDGISAWNIPENLSILKTDFDSSIDLRKKYWVTAQHTFVQVDSDGEMIKKWVWGTAVDDILERIN